MPGEKEININLFERLDLLDRLERVARKANCEPVLQEIDFERKSQYHQLCWWFELAPLGHNLCFRLKAV